jgi:putative zinc finger/helix-turn-helix YgiT family protein
MPDQRSNFGRNNVTPKKTARCADCGSRTIESAEIPYTAIKNHDGRRYELHIPRLAVSRCTACGEVYFGRDADHQIAQALRLHLKLLAPEEIENGLRRLHLTQKEFADQLGVAQETVSRWIRGSMIQSRAMDNLMRLYLTVPDARAALARMRSHGEATDLLLAAAPEPVADTPERRDASSRSWHRTSPLRGESDIRTVRQANRFTLTASYS